MNTYNTELFHYGIKGMKWGVRKKSRSDKKSTKNKVAEKWKDLSPRTKNVIKIDASAAAVAIAAYGGYRYRNFVNDKATTVAVAKGKAIYEEVSASGFGAFKSAAMGRASIQSSEHVSRVANSNIIDQRSEIKEFNRIRKRIKRGQQVSDFDRAWNYYMEHPDRGADILIKKRKR